MRTFLVLVFFIGVNTLCYSQSGVDLQVNTIPSVSYFQQTGNTLNVFSQARLEPINVTPHSSMNINNPFRVGFYLSTDPIITTSDILIATYIVPSITIQGSHNCAVYSVDLTTVAGLNPGTYYIGVYIDDLNDVFWETDENNNNHTFKDWSNNFVQVTYGSVGIDENSFENDIEFLNTADGITVSSKLGNTLTIELFSLNGQLMFSASGPTLNISSKPYSGIYIISIKSNQQIYRRKLHF